MKAKRGRREPLRYGIRAATLERKGKFVVADLLFERGTAVLVEKSYKGVAEVGDLVLVEVGPGRARVVEAVGSPASARDVVAALLADRGCPRDFSIGVEAEADRQRGRSGDSLRRDLTELPAFTIDPATARDYDDAISVEAEGAGVRLYVHIADVSAFVGPGSLIEQDAYRRSCSVYVPGMVVPMIPRALSDDLCSLAPGKPRQTVTVEMAIDDKGKVTATQLYRSLIASDTRLTYDEVDDFLAGGGGAIGGWRRGHRADTTSLAGIGLAQRLELARRLAATLRKRRYRRGALTLATQEPEFEFDAGGEVIAARLSMPTESHNLIEEFMILANEQVASYLEQGNASFLYRIHEQPSPESVRFLVEQLESIEVATPPLPEDMSSRQAGELLTQIGAMVEKHLSGRENGRLALTSLVLRSLQQAIYSPLNRGHAGLASPSYCHFTSPIRRYPDLVVHRALLQELGLDRQGHAAHELEEVGWHCSAMERAAAEIEREADDICLAYLLSRELYEQGWEQLWEGEVTGLIPAGAFVQFGIYEGFLPARDLAGEYFKLNRPGTALVGRRSGATLRLGDPVDVRVERVEWESGRIDLTPATEGRHRRRRYVLNSYKR